MDELYHYGIKGMKWGVWNEETRTRYNGGTRVSRTKNSSAVKSSKIAKKARARNKENKEYKKRISKIDKMSDEDLNNRINRLRQEKQLRDLEYEKLTSSRKSNSAMKRGAKYVGNIVAQSGKNAATKVGTAVFVYAGMKYIETKCGISVANSIKKYIKTK